ncbi:hypothetical protein C7C56_002895 [Massilia glaciei]|uniref:Uncharacterized protein n=2 Tax=Massilia glaciei TaxID=1524097 RepID=A0A2U2I657_9BURK|nr:hypothetical protein C7C56_002895 [Massilia glaciei]
MGLVISAALALGVGLACSLARFDRERVFYPTLMIVIALYYALFAVIGGAPGALLAESLAITVFAGAALAGFRINLWIVVAALAAHGLYDALHGALIHNPGVPPWWPAFCLGYDLAAAGYLAVLLLLSPPLSQPQTKRTA